MHVISIVLVIPMFKEEPYLVAAYRDYMGGPCPNKSPSDGWNWLKLVPTTHHMCWERISKIETLYTSGYYQRPSQLTHFHTSRHSIIVRTNHNYARVAIASRNI